jgi:RloB-like protein
MTGRRVGTPIRRIVHHRRRTLLAFTEGERTEEQYLTRWKRLLRDQVTLRIDPYHGSPMHLVNRAIAAQDIERRESRRRHGSPYDEIWCVFDHDGRQEVPEAIARAEQRGIRVAFSNPCIELWFVLHFDHHASWVTADQIQHRAAELLGCGKNMTEAALNVLGDRYEQARANAQAITDGHVRAGEWRCENPSSTLWQLIESMYGR